MGVRKRLNRALLLAFAVLLLHTRCWKEEYSYEGSPRDTAILPAPLPLPDTATDTAFLFAPCPVCKHANPLLSGQWRFRYDTSFLCGNVTNAVMNPERDAFTFFGPSACTPGTGLIITAYFKPVTFDNDRVDITSTRVTFQYYDNNGPQDIFRSSAATQASITINQYEHSSRIATGRFSGTVLTGQQTVISINEGDFNIQLK
jgi:hypothetical protein